MTNADKFKGIFGMYATELCAKPEKEFLEWLNADVPNLDDGGTISRQAAIEALDGEITVTGRANAEAVRGYANLVCDRIKRLPSAQPRQTCEYWDSESNFCALYRPHAQPERKKGKWIDAVLPNDNGGLPVQVCDQCNTFFPLTYTGGGHRFCPSCGAKMEVEHE